MLKYCKVINEETKEVSVGLGTNADFYKSIGYEEKEIEKINGTYYLKDYAPKPDIEKTKQELLNQLKNNIETHIYNHYPRYRQDNIAIYGTDDERNNFKIFKEYSTNIYHTVEKQIRETNDMEELNKIEVDINIFEKSLRHCEEQSDVAIPRPESYNPCLDEQPQGDINND